MEDFSDFTEQFVLNGQEEEGIESEGESVREASMLCYWLKKVDLKLKKKKCLCL